MRCKADVIWLNGAFGVGKTTVAELLVEEIDGAALVDPELIGEMLRQLAPAASQTDDWQDMPMWRSLTRDALAGLVTAGHGPLVVPMTIVDPGYFDETVVALRRAGITVSHFTLVASTETILSRLVVRDAARNQWARDRAVDCVGSLHDRLFVTHIDAEARDPAAIAAEILERLAA